MHRQEVDGKITHYAYPGEWAHQPKYPAKFPALVLGVDYERGIVRGMVLDEQDELGISLYRIEMLEEFKPSTQDMARFMTAIKPILQLCYSEESVA